MIEWGVGGPRPLLSLPPYVLRLQTNVGKEKIART